MALLAKLRSLKSLGSVLRNILYFLKMTASIVVKELGSTFLSVQPEFIVRIVIATFRIQIVGKFL